MKSSPVRAAEYMRMSTEHQQYSIANQAAAIQEYANAQSMEIVRTYADRGKSGLDIKKRPGLQSLLQTATAGGADFSVVLVYDVSRWGRFQDVDESAYYEYSLKKAGVAVIYCAEPFRDTGAPTDALLKTVKRAMAAEYSRELSRKVAQGQRRIAQLGFRLGGVSGFGLRRIAVDPAGSRRTILADGEQKSIKTDRVTLVRGPRNEVSVVRRVFRLFVEQELSETEISRLLNADGILTRRGNQWTREPIYRMLINPKYVGDLAYGRTVSHMGSAPIANTQDKWVYLANQFPPIVSRRTWNRAQELFRKRKEFSEKEEMLRLLRCLLAKHGRLGYDLIDAEPGMPSAQTYMRQFGSIFEAYRRVGWKTSTRGVQTTRRPEVRACRATLSEAITNKVAQSAATFSKHPKLPLWIVNGQLSIYTALVVATQQPQKRLSWKFCLDLGSRKPPIDVLVIARLDIHLALVRDYYVFAGCCPKSVTIFEHNPWSLDIHRFEDLSFIGLLCSQESCSEFGGSLE